VNLRWASAAVKEAAVEYYQQRKVGLGDEFAAALDEAVEKIKTQPDWFGLLETISTEFSIVGCECRNFLIWSFFGVRANGSKSSLLLTLVVSRITGLAPNECYVKNQTTTAAQQS
jgi:hypothetical protein